MGILYHEFLLIATCEKTNFVHAIPMQNRQTETIANALLHRVCCLTGPPTKLSIDQDSALTSQVIKELLTSLECTMQIISPWNHGSSKAERQIQTIGNMIIIIIIINDLFSFQLNTVFHVSFLACFLFRK